METIFIKAQEFVVTHPGVVSLAVAWASRELHLWWPRIVAIYPYVSENGGVIGLAKTFFVGKSKP